MNRQLDTRRENRPRSFFDLMSAFDDLFTGSLAMSSPALSRMLTDIQENEQGYVMSIDMPGVGQDDIQIQVDGNILTVSAERQAEQNVEGGAQGYSRQYRKYQQSFTLPMTVKSDEIEANYENGVLELFIPKSAQAQPKKVQIQSGKGSFLNRLMGKSGQNQQAQGKTEQQKTAAKH